MGRLSTTECTYLPTSMHFMCSLLDTMELDRNLEQRSWARHRIWRGQDGQATAFRIS